MARACYPRLLNPMRVLLLNQAAWPDVVATAQHLDDLARHLVRSGHEVHVVASRATHGAAGATLPREQVQGGVEHHRVGRNLFGKTSLLARAFDFALFHPAAFVRALFLPRPDLVVTLSTPPFLAATALLLARLRGAPLVYWVMDLYPDVPVACGVLPAGGLAARVLERLHRFVLRRCDRVIVLGRCMQMRVLAKGVSADRLSLVRPWADPDEMHATAGDIAGQRAAWGVSERFVVLYSGNLGLAHEFETLARAASLLAVSHPQVRFVFVGSGAARADAERLFAPGGNASFFPAAARSSLGVLLASGDAHLVTLRDGAEGALVPSKFFGILAAARPVLYVGPADSELALLTEEIGCGSSLRCGDARGLASSISRLVDDPSEGRRQGEAGHSALEQHHARALGCSRIEAVLCAAAGTREGA